MANLLLVGGCVAAGWLLRGRVSAASLNQVALSLSLPALTLVSLHRVQEVHWHPVLSVWLVFAGAVLWCEALGRWRGWDRATIVCMILTAGLSNTSFMGFPLLEAYLGKESLAVGVQIDQLGSFLLLSTLGVATVSRAVGRDLQFREVIFRILRFLPLHAAVLGLLLRPWPLPPALEEALSRLGATLSPLALVSVGTQLRWPDARSAEKLTWGLCYKLLIAPAGTLMYLRFCRLGGLDARATLAEAAMAPMVTGALLATEANLAPELASAMVSVGVPLSLISVWLWCQIG